METAVEPLISQRNAPDGGLWVEVIGAWNLRTTRERTADLLEQLGRAGSGVAHWDLTRLDELDIAGATLLWRAWQQRKPEGLSLRPQDERLFRLLAAISPGDRTARRSLDFAGALVSLGSTLRSLATHAIGMVELLGQISLWALRLARNPREIPYKEISAAVFRSGTQSLPITALVGLLIGIVLSYLSAEQLRELGADSLIVNLLGVTILRELGPLLAAILNAGRSGSSMTAQIGLMRVTEELEAMAVLGISPALRLALPRMIGQMIAVPLVVLWTDVLALVGGMLGAKLQLGISYTAL